MDCWLHSTPDLKDLFSTNKSQYVHMPFLLYVFSKPLRLLNTAFNQSSQVE